MLTTTIGGTQFIGRRAGDFSGVAVAGVGDVNGDGFNDILIGAPLADRLGNTGAVVAQRSGGATLVYGTGTTQPAVVDLIELEGTEGVFFSEIADEFAEFGTSVGGLGDFNGDGFDDIIISAPFRSRIANQDTGEGAAYIRFGVTEDINATISTPSISGGSGFRIIGSAEDSFLGMSVRGAGDFNGDGISDAVIGMTGLGTSLGLGTGGALVLFGSDAAIPDFPATSDAVDGRNGLRIVGAAVGDFAGVSVAGVGDVNGDGLDDLAVGATGARGSAAGSGAAYIVYGTGSGASTINLGTLDGTNGYKLAGVATGDRAGIAVAGLGDINGDGRADILVGADEAGGSGRAYVVFGSSTAQPATRALGSLNGSTGFRIDGIGVSDSMGTAVSSAGDVNGDGLDDFLIGALSADPFGETSAGQTFLVYGRRNGFGAVLDPLSLDGTNGFIFAGEFAQDVSGSSVAAAGDMNGDGFDDLLIGAPGADIGAEGYAGITYLIYGGHERLLAQDGLDGVLDGVVDLRGLGEEITFFDGDVLRGTDASETLRGSAGAEGLYGLDGHDKLYGTGGTDFFDGGAGNDRVVAGAGGDSVLGGEGNDVILTYAGNDRIEGGAGTDTLVAGVGNDRVNGGDGDDNLKGDDGNDVLRGDAGDDVISGWRGADSIQGGDGADVIRGDFDDDRIEGGAGDDRLLGGGGFDVFVFRSGFGEDRILDFRPTGEVLDFSGHSGVQRFADLDIVQVGTSVVIDDGAGGRIVLADMSLSQITAADFLF